jgi:hypothetical protein
VKRALPDGLELDDERALPEPRARGRAGAEAIDGGPFRELPWYLNTVDAHGLYAKLGLGPPDAARMMYRPRREA